MNLWLNFDKNTLKTIHWIKIYNSLTFGIRSATTTLATQTHLQLIEFYKYWAIIWRGSSWEPCTTRHRAFSRFNQIFQTQHKMILVLNWKVANDKYSFKICWAYNFLFFLPLSCFSFSFFSAVLFDFVSLCPSPSISSIAAPMSLFFF